MNMNRNLFLKVIVAISLALPLGAADAIRYNSVPNECKVRMEGTSTIHDWHAESGVIGGSLEAEPGFPDSAKGPVQPKAEVNIPVRSLKTSGGRKMDSVMQEHMKATEHKMIKYTVIEMSPKGANSAGGTDFETKGTLTIAGVTRTNTMPVTVSKVGDTKLKIVGNTKLQMTAYGISPPAPDIGLGLIKTGDEVTIQFEWVTEKAQ
jgi:hypothetical protein